MKTTYMAAVLLTLGAALGGCYSVTPVDRVDTGAMMGEGTVVFARPSKYTPYFGTYSPRDYFEVVYERFSTNEANLPVVEVGLRYRGGVSWTDWFRDMPQTVTLTAVCSFYADMRAQAGGPAIFATNRERIVFQRGMTYAYKAVCPLTNARGYQLVLGE